MESRLDSHMVAQVVHAKDYGMLYRVVAEEAKDAPPGRISAKALRFSALLQHYEDA